MWPSCLFSFWSSLANWLTGCIGFHRNCFISNRFLWYIFFTPNFKFGKVHIPWFLFCSDKIHRGCVRQHAKVCIFQSRWRTRHCVGFWVSSHPSYKFLRNYEYPRTFGCNRTFRGWRTCRNMRRQVRRCRFRFCHHSFFSFLFLHPFRHRAAATYQAGILSAANRAEMADVEQMKKIILFVTCEITFGQNVCELMFGVDVPNWILGSRLILSKNPIQSNSVGSGHMSQCGTSAFDHHLIHGFIIVKNIYHRIGTRWCSAWWNVINVGQIQIGVRNWNWFSQVWLNKCRQVSPSLFYIFGFVGLVKNEIFQPLIPKDRQKSHPCVNLLREEWFQLL